MIMTDVEIAQAQAASYVWGRQDAGESASDTGYSIEFAAAFAERRRQYDAGESGFMPNLERAFTMWRDTRKIT